MCKQVHVALTHARASLPAGAVGIHEHLNRIFGAHVPDRRRAPRDPRAPAKPDRKAALSTGCALAYDVYAAIEKPPVKVPVTKSTRRNP
jgi:hypothetical protein